MSAAADRVSITPEKMEKFEKAYMAEPFNLAVFPTILETKIPMCVNGFYDSTRDFEILRALHGGRPHGLAIATGALSGVWVLDVDVKHQNGKETLAALERENATLPETWTVETPSGGLHLYFAWTDVLPIGSRVNVFPGIDTRGSGGYVVAPPTPGYVWLISPSQIDHPAIPPEWLINAITEQQRSAGHGEGIRPRVDQRIYLEGAHEGNRNEYLTSFAGWLISRARPDDRPDVLFTIVSDHNTLHNVPPISEHEVVTIFRSIYRSNSRKA